MAGEVKKPAATKEKYIVNVAVAVIHYQEQYLLGFRSSTQHQGDRYEFVGGKIDTDETAEQALIREVNEETGIDIGNNTIVKLGRLHHDYGDKQVCLQVYDIELTVGQYERYKQYHYGLEGQALTWVNKFALLAGDYRLPAANKTILEWLQLPSQITITYPLAHFSDHSNPTAAWLIYHQQHLPKKAWVYIRAKAPEAENMANQLMGLRPDVQTIVPARHDFPLNSHLSLLADNKQIVANHLTHTELMQWFDEVKRKPQSSQLASSNALLSSTLANRPLIVSCHNEESICAANLLAKTRLQQQRPPIMGIFLSPVLMTQTHPDAEYLGWEAWSILAELADMPVIGLGGLSPALLEQAKKQGATSIAGIRQFFAPTLL